MAGLQSGSSQTAAASRRRWPAVLVAAAGLTAAGVGVWWFMPPESPAEPTTATASGPETTAAAAPPSSQPVLPPSAPPPNVADPTKEVWKLLASNDRPGVVRLLKTAPPGQGGSPAPLALEVLKTVQGMVGQTREMAATAPGAVPSDLFRSAEERRTAATQLAGRGNAIAAIESLWQAGDLYAKVVTSSRPGIPPAADAQSAPRETLAAAPTSPAPAAPPSPAPVPAPSPSAAVVSVPPPQVQVPATDVTPRPTAPSNVVDRAPAVETPRPPSAEDGVREALDRYRAAYAAMDAVQVAAVYPQLSAAQLAEIRNSFQGLSTYEIEIREPQIQIKGDDATVEATVVRRFSPKVGNRNPITRQDRTLFQLGRAGRGWVITQVTVR